MKRAKVTKEYREKISRRMKEVWVNRRIEKALKRIAENGKSNHCYLNYCHYATDRKCICLCVGCALAKKDDRMRRCTCYIVQATTYEVYIQDPCGIHREMVERERERCAQMVERMSEALRLNPSSTDHDEWADLLRVDPNHKA